jgi:hypothetical protein
MNLQSPVATGITLDLLYKIKVPWMKEAVMEMKNYKEKMEEKKTHKSNGLPQRL